MDPGNSPHAALKNVVLSCLFCFLTGFVYSLGVFSPSVEAAGHPEGSLDGVWSSGIALVSAFSIPAMFFGGVYLGQDCHTTDINDIAKIRTSRARLIVAAGSLSYALIGLAGYGVYLSSPFFIRVAFVFAGAGFGLVFLQSMELLGASVPRQPGLAVGVGQMTYGLGSIAASSVYSYLLQNFSTPQAIYITAVIMSLPTAAAIPFISWPQEAAETSEEHETDPLVAPTQTTPLTMKQLTYRPQFWMYFISIFSLRAGFAFVAYYFKIGQTFGKDVSALVTSFQAATTVGTLSRPLTGALVDKLKMKEGFFSLGSKNMIIALAIIQACSFLALIPISADRSYVGFAFFAGVAQVIFAAGSCCAPLLAREQFGAVNSCLVYGAGGSLSMGLGEIVAVWGMTLVERLAGKADTPSAYQGFYVASFVWSACGLVAGMLLRKDMQHSKNDSVEAPKTSYTENGPVFRSCESGVGESVRL